MASPHVTLLSLSVCIGAIVAAFQNDIEAALDIALHRATYSYCLFIPFISLALIHDRRAELAGLAPRPCLWGVVVGGAAAAAWGSGAWAGIAELRQMAVVLLLQGAFLALLGWRIYRVLLFPLLYLFLMVPTGGYLLGPLQSITTWAAAGLLWLSQIPVSVHGDLVTVPLRTYRIEPACAGLNFLLVALALSLLYAWLFYRATGKRLAAVALALSLAILANAVRVYGIIALAEFTDRRIDLGPQDHLLHGWVFFSAIILAVMAFGLLFKDRQEAAGR